MGIGTVVRILASQAICFAVTVVVALSFDTTITLAAPVLIGIVVWFFWEVYEGCTNPHYWKDGLNDSIPTQEQPSHTWD